MPLKDVIEANAEEGWRVETARDENDMVVTEIVDGDRIIVRRRVEEPVVLTWADETPEAVRASVA